MRNYILQTIRQVHEILRSMPTTLDRYATPVVPSYAKSYDASLRPPMASVLVQGVNLRVDVSVAFLIYDFIKFMEKSFAFVLLR